MIEALLIIRKGILDCGGLFRTMRRFFTILLTEGIPGIKQRIVANKYQYYSKQDTAYIHWVEQFDTISEKNREAFRSAIREFESHPLISIILPVYDPPSDVLMQTLESVRSQLYSNWELCVADDNSPNPEVKKILQTASESDPRIRVIYREDNGHISAASNSAFQIASGKFVALLDHDDLLSEHALFWVVKEINEYPDAMLIYSDEDKIDISGYRHDPYFKSDWNQDLFLSHNMFSHLGVYRTDLLKKIGGFRVGYEGAQDHDLVLRCLSEVEPSQIRHIPRILYHWRNMPGSTARGVDEKPYAMQSGEQAINDYFKRNAVRAKAHYNGKGYRTKYQLPSPVPLVSLIIPTRNEVEVLRTCINSIVEKTDYDNYEVIVVDNGSDDPATLHYLEELKRRPRFTVMRDDGPFNFSALNNKAVKIAAGTVIGMVNNDIEVISSGWMTELVAQACRRGVGAVGAKLYYPDNTIQHAGIILGIGKVAGHSHKYLPRSMRGYCSRAILQQFYSAVTGACLFVRKELYFLVGGLNETNLAVAFNDVDFCLKLMEKGYSNVWTPYAELYHYESKSRGLEDTPEKLNRFSREIDFMFNRWSQIIANDPAYNPNLTIEEENFSLAFPPRVKHVL